MDKSVSSKVSVVIPTYNGARFIRETLESVFGQMLLPKEIIVVDDASSDETSKIVISMIPTAPIPLRLISLKTNSGGPARPLNIGIDAASGELISVLDQDDVFLSQKLENQVKAFEVHPETGFVFSFCGDYENPRKILQSPAFLEELVCLSRKISGSYSQICGRDALFLFTHSEEGNYVFGFPGFIFRRKDWLRKGGLDESLRIGSDYDFLCWLSGQGPVGFFAEIFYLRREHGKNLSKHVALMWEEFYRVRDRYL